MKCLISIVLLLFQFNIGVAQFSKKEVKQREEKLAAFYENQQFVEVIGFAKELAAAKANMKPESVEFWLDANRQQHDLEGALQCFFYLDEFRNAKLRKKLSTSHQKQIEDLNKLLRLYQDVVEVQRYSDVERRQALIKAIEIDDQYWRPYFDLAVVNLRLKNYVEAIPACLKVLQLNPRHLESVQGLMDAYYYSKDYSNALIQADQLLKMGYMREDVYYIKAYSHFQMGEYQNCLLAIDKALEYQPNDHDYLVLKIHSAEKLNRNRLVLSTIFKLWEQAKLSIPSINYGYGFVNDDNRIDVLAQIDKLVESQPDNTRYLLFRSKLYILEQMDEFELALADLDRIIELEDTNSDFYVMKGLMLFRSRLGDRDERNKLASDNFEKALVQDSLNYDLYDLLCRSNMWVRPSYAKKFKAIALKNMRIKLNKFPTDATVNFEMSQTFNLPSNGTGSNTQYHDSMLKYENLSLLYGMDSMTVIYERRYHWPKEEYQKAIADNWWLYKNGSEWVQSNSLYTIANHYSSVKQFQKEIEILNLIAEKFPNDKSVQRRLREARRDLSKYGK